MKAIVGILLITVFGTSHAAGLLDHVVKKESQEGSLSVMKEVFNNTLNRRTSARVPNRALEAIDDAYLAGISLANNRRMTSQEAHRMTAEIILSDEMIDHWVRSTIGKHKPEDLKNIPAEKLYELFANFSESLDHIEQRIKAARVPGLAEKSAGKIALLRARNHSFGNKLISIFADSSLAVARESIESINLIMYQEGRVAFKTGAGKVQQATEALASGVRPNTSTGWSGKAAQSAGQFMRKALGAF